MHVYVYMCISMCVCMYACMSMYVCMHVCVPLYMDVGRESEDRQLIGSLSILKVLRRKLRCSEKEMKVKDELLGGGVLGYSGLPGNSGATQPCSPLFTVLSSLDVVSCCALCQLACNGLSGLTGLHHAEPILV